MFNRNFILFFVCFFLLSMSLDAQETNDSTRILPQVEVVENKIDILSLGLDIVRIDSLTKRDYAFSNIGTLLQNSSSVFIKNYGPSGISSMSFRGLGASQSMVYWNEIPLSSPNLGMVDISLIPSGSFNDVKIQMGGGSAIFGSGNMAGALHLGNKIDFKKDQKLIFGGLIGTANRYHSSLQYKYSNEKIFLKTQVFGYRNKNNYLYNDLYGNKIKRENAKEEHISIMQDFAYKVSKNQWLQFGLWYLNSENDIPASLTSAKSDASQNAESKRLFLKYHLYKKKLSYKFQSSLLIDEMLYSDPDSVPSLAIESKIKSRVWDNRIETKYRINSEFQLFSSLFYSYEEAKSKSYDGDVFRQKAGFTMALNTNFFKQKLKSNLSIRKDFLIPKFPFLYSLNTSYDILKILKLKAHISSNYRLPTFNDLYWQALGNPNLEPEFSNNFEVGLEYQPKKIIEKKELSGKVKFTVFHYDFINRIIWTPQNGIWKPSNLSTMTSQGGEIHLQIIYTSKIFSHHFNGHYTYANSRSEKKQLIYTPKHTVSGNYTLIYKKTRLSISQKISSSYYTNEDNSISMPSYYLTDIVFSKEFSIQNWNVNFALKVGNLFDLDYQIISYYPMPGRNFELKLLFSI